MNKGRGKWTVENDGHEASHLLVTGMSGKGKSTLTRQLVSEDGAVWKFAFDTYKREFHKKLGWNLCYDLPTLQAAYRAGRPSTFIHDPSFVPDVVSAFNIWIEWVVGCAKCLPGRKLLVIEEVQSTTKNVNSPINPQFAWALDQGRGCQFDVIMTAQRVNTIAEGVRSSVTEFCTFQHVWENQLDWLAREGFERGAVKVLERGQYIWLDKERGTITHGHTRQPPAPRRSGERLPGSGRPLGTGAVVAQEKPTA